MAASPNLPLLTVALLHEGSRLQSCPRYHLPRPPLPSDHLVAALVLLRSLSHSADQPCTTGAPDCAIQSFL